MPIWSELVIEAPDKHKSKHPLIDYVNSEVGINQVGTMSLM